MKKLMFVVLSSFCFASLAAAPAFAGDKTPLSALPTLPSPKDAETPPKVYGVPGLTLKEEAGARSTYYELTAAAKQGYCLVSQQDALQLSTSTSDTDGTEMWRFVEQDGKATIERTSYQVAPYLNNAWVRSKSRVELKALATDHGVTAWGMREANGDVVVIATGASGGRESVRRSATPDEGPSFSFLSSDCTFGGVRLSAYVVSHGGGSAQLRGHFPAVGEGKDRVQSDFSIDVSVLKLSRDPEPILSARIRKIDP